MAAKVGGIGEDGLEVHGFPEGECLDVGGFQGQAEVFPDQAVIGGRIDENRGEPAVAEGVGRFFLEADVTSLGVRKRAVWMKSLSLPSRAPPPLVVMILLP